MRHYFADALQAQLCSAGGSDGVGNDRADLILGQLLGQVISQDFGFGMFFLGQLCAAGVAETPQVVLADAGYWHQVQMQALAGDGIQVLIPPDANKRKGARPGWDVAASTRYATRAGDRARR